MTSCCWRAADDPRSANVTVSRPAAGEAPQTCSTDRRRSPWREAGSRPPLRQDVRTVGRASLRRSQARWYVPSRRRCVRGRRWAGFTCTSRRDGLRRRAAARRFPARRTDSIDQIYYLNLTGQCRLPQRQPRRRDGLTARSMKVVPPTEDRLPVIKERPFGAQAGVICSALTAPCPPGRFHEPLADPLSRIWWCSLACFMYLYRGEPAHSLNIAHFLRVGSITTTGPARRNSSSSTLPPRWLPTTTRAANELAADLRGRARARPTADPLAPEPARSSLALLQRRRFRRPSPPAPGARRHRHQVLRSFLGTAFSWWSWRSSEPRPCRAPALARPRLREQA